MCFYGITITVTDNIPHNGHCSVDISRKQWEPVIIIYLVKCETNLLGKGTVDGNAIFIDWLSHLGGGGGSG